MDRRTGHSTGAVCEYKTLSFNIDLHSGQRIDQGKDIRAARFCRSCHLGDIGDIRAQFHDHRLFCLCLHCFCDRLHRLWILSKRDASLFYIRAGNVDLKHIDRLIRQSFHNLEIIFGCFSTDIHNDLRIIFFEKRNITLNKKIDPRILKSDRV